METILKVMEFLGIGKLKFVDPDKATTVLGYIKAVAAVLATYNYVGVDPQSPAFWIGLAYAISTAIQGYMTNKPKA